jgi:hypothetical protein
MCATVSSAKEEGKFKMFEDKIRSRISRPRRVKERE